MILIGAIVSTLACGRQTTPQSPVPIEDLTRDFSRAERRSGGDADTAIRLDLAGPDDDREVALLADAPSRVTWLRRVPPRAQLSTAVWLVSGEGATARFGVADGRTYELFARVELSATGTPLESRPAWRPVTVDLGAYGGWQWSFFYRPGQTTWRLVFSVDASPGGTIAWRRPSIEARR